MLRELRVVLKLAIRMVEAVGVFEQEPCAAVARVGDLSGYVIRRLIQPPAVEQHTD